MSSSLFPDISELKKKVVNPHITIKGYRVHTKASEKYVDVILNYPKHKLKWDGSVPIEYRRTGVKVETCGDIANHLQKAYILMSPENYHAWLEKQNEYWEGSRAVVTKPFFEGLKTSSWKCCSCELPSNPNFARRIQDLKEMGYTLATDTKRYCSKCKKNTTHLIMLHLPRGGKTGYETWSQKLRKRILIVLENYDVYDGRKSTHLLPDHKFSEIRWDENTKEENSDDMSVADIQKKFQLINNQRNQQKREVCRKCFQTGKRGYPFNIKYFYEGDETWPKNVSKTGKEAENGCQGCGWYDMEKWRVELQKKLNRP